MTEVAPQTLSNVVHLRVPNDGLRIRPKLRSRIVVRGIQFEILSREGDGTWNCLELSAVAREVTFSPQERAALVEDNAIAILPDIDDPAELLEQLNFDWETDVTEEQRQRARFRSAILTALDEIVATPEQRKESKYILGAVKSVVDSKDFNFKAVTPRAVREWDKRWAPLGKTVKGQMPNDYRKGNRKSGERFEWIRTKAMTIIKDHEDAGRLIDVVELDRKIEAAVKLMAAEHALPLRENLVSDRAIGVNYVRNLVNGMGYIVRQDGKLTRKEARRRAKGISIGPQGRYPLNEVEVDHTPLDVLVKRPGKKPGRLYLTVLIDRYSRYIIGFYLTFEPPSWYSVAMALRLAVMPKKQYLASLNYPFTFKWVNYGAPDRLYMDRAAEFRSGALTSAARDLRISLRDLPAARGDLKGKVERACETIQHEVSKQLPGYTGPNILERDEERAIATITQHQVERLLAAWIVDRYHQREHTTTGRKPQDMYMEGLSRMKIEKLPPTTDILGPLESDVQSPWLTNQGISLDGLRYQSTDLHAMWFAAGADHHVIARPDPYNCDIVLVRQDRGKWIEASLIGEYAGTGLSRADVADRRKAARYAEVDPETALAERRAELNLQGELDALHKPRKRKTDRSKIPQKAAVAINIVREDGVASAQTPIGWSPSRPVPTNRSDIRGPFASKSRSERVIANLPEGDAAQDIGKHLLDDDLNNPVSPTPAIEREGTNPKLANDEKHLPSATSAALPKRPSRSRRSGTL